MLFGATIRPTGSRRSRRNELPDIRFECAVSVMGNRYTLMLMGATVNECGLSRLKAVSRAHDLNSSR